eukprot:541330-Pyramimonas_sp.AAC.1
MTKAEAVDYEYYAEASPPDAIVQKKFQDETRMKMLEVAKMVMGARRAGEAEDVARLDTKL